MNKVCPQSEKCCELNPDHFDEYKHPHLNDLLQQGDNLYLPDNFPQSRQVVMEQLSVLKTLQIDSTQKDVCKDEPSTSNADSNKITSRAVNSPKHQKYTMADKMKSNYPYNLFFTTIPKLRDTLNQKNSITFSDLLCPSLGELKCSLQLNFLVEIEWLIEQYKVHNVHTKPLTVVYGWDLPDMADYIQKFLPNVKHHLMKLKNPMGHHHCKIGVYVYTDNSIRIVVSTANLYYEDWNHYNNGLWVSPRCPQLPRNTPCDKGESPTGFKSTLLKYLKTYKLYLIKDFMRYISNADFSSVNVFFVASTPGTHYPNGTECHLYRTLNLLSSHCKIDSDPDSWEVNVQASSLGSFGKRPIDWLQSVLLRSLACRQNYSPIPDPQVNINIIYPTVDDAVSCYFEEDGAGCLHYLKDLHKKQLWLQTYLQLCHNPFRLCPRKWCADSSSRTKAMPHIKTYCRISPCKSKLAWFLLTSSNISRAGWGSGIGKNEGVCVRSYEAGVMFFPSFFNQEYFELINGENNATFPFMYDTVLKNYAPDDSPWTD